LKEGATELFLKKVVELEGKSVSNSKIGHYQSGRTEMKMMMFYALLVTLAFFANTVQGQFQLAESCKIFCHGPLLDAIQRAHIFTDSKDFVDMPLKFDPDTTLKAFEQLPDKTDPMVLREFVSQYFMEPGTELTACHQTDWVPEPASFARIRDPVYRQWAYDINMKWRSLCRRMKDDVKRSPERYSLIHVPHPFVAPGGRFREFYYWDTYWIIKGLLASEMYNSTKLMIMNLGEMVRRFGFVPNGGRIYYLHRTQPPVLAACVHEYFQATNDLAFVRTMLPLLEKERAYWQRERLVDWKTADGASFELYQYRVNAQGPRPESYIEDLETASHDPTDAGKQQIWSDIAAAAESGWDFSSRWFTRDPNSQYKNSLRGVRTSRVVPVDLNAFICWNDGILADLYAAIGNETESRVHQSNSDKMRYAMHKVFWNNEHGSWFDLDLETNEQRREYYVSNPTPLFAKCAHRSKDVHKQVLEYLKSTSAWNMPGGLPTSFVDSGEQWDAPNGWAPTNHMVVEGLRNSSDPQIQEAAFRLANKWIQTNYFVYIRSGGKMFEKYSVDSFKSKAGGGGEYEVQDGFGWTNGVVLDLLLQYGDRLRAPPLPAIVFEAQQGVGENTVV
jgi:alpha,alpha-trehalase